MLRNIRASAHGDHSHIGYSHARFPLAHLRVPVTLVSLDERPLVIRRRVAVVRVQVGQHADVLARVLSVVRCESLAAVIRILDVQVIGLAVLAIVAGNTLFALVTLNTLESRPCVLGVVRAVFLCEVYICTYIDIRGVRHRIAVFIL